MPTNAIGAGTRNASINFRTDELESFRALAARLVNAGVFRSVSDAYRQFMRAGAALYSPNFAVGIRDLRNAAMAAALLCLVCHLTWLSWQPGGDDESMLRARRGRSQARATMRVRGAVRCNEMEIV